MVELKVSYQLQREALKLDVDLTVPGQGVTMIFGPSGAGKTTLLRAIAGLETDGEGDVRLGDAVWQHGSSGMPVHQRALAYVFQETSLFAHLTAEQNLQYSIKRCKKPLDMKWYERLLDILQLKPLLQRFPGQLSGGEKQRVAIARALLQQPDLLLMDEPLASVDAQSRNRILNYIDNLVGELGIPCLYVTHSVNEVIRLADYLLMMNDGKVTVQGDLQSPAVLNALQLDEDGQLFNLLSGTVKEIDESYQLATVDVNGLDVRLAASGLAAGQVVRLRLNARDISLCLGRPDATSILNVLPCEVISCEVQPCGLQCLVEMICSNLRIKALITRYSAEHLQLKHGMAVFAQVKALSVIQ